MNYRICIACLEIFFCDLRVLARNLAGLFGHPMKVSRQVHLASTCESVWPPNATLYTSLTCIYWRVCLARGLVEVDCGVIFKHKPVKQEGPDHFQQQLRNSGMAYLKSFVKQHHLTVLNLDLRLIFLRSIF